MAWTEKQKREHSKRMKAIWAKKSSTVLTDKDIEVLNIGATADMVAHPPHYTFGKFEVIDVLEDWFPTNPLLWQVGKYIARAEHKGHAIQDLKKAKFYLEREIERIENADRVE